MNPNPPQNKEERFQKILLIVRENARFQSTDEYRENYLKSCEAHGGEVAEAAKQVRAEMEPKYRVSDSPIFEIACG